MTNGLMDVATDLPDTQLPEGTPVDVRNRFVGSWSHGFEVAERVQGGYRVPTALRRQCAARCLPQRGRQVGASQAGPVVVLSTVVLQHLRIEHGVARLVTDDRAERGPVRACRPFR